jgi:hypothetical protein
VNPPQRVVPRDSKTPVPFRRPTIRVQKCPQCID